MSIEVLIGDAAVEAVLEDAEIEVSAQGDEIVVEVEAGQTGATGPAGPAGPQGPINAIRIVHGGNGSFPRSGTADDMRFWFGTVEPANALLHDLYIRTPG